MTLERPGTEDLEPDEKDIRTAWREGRRPAIRGAGAIIALTLSGGLLTLGPARVASYVDGPPPGHTGGFGEPTCRSCHFDNPLQPAGRNLSVSGLPATYIPGDSYRLEIELLAPDARRAGFQLSARFASGLDAGDQSGGLGSSGDRVSVVTASASGIQYAQQTRRGATLEAPGPARWSVDWTAPSHRRAPVAFHIAANAANGDDSAFGDRIFAAELIVEPAPPSQGREIRGGDARSEAADAGSEAADATFPPVDAGSRVVYAWPLTASGELERTATDLGAGVPEAQTAAAEFQVTGGEFRGLSAAGAGVVWAGGRGGVFASSADGGTTWRADTIPGAEGLFLIDSHAVDGRTAYLLGTDFDGGMARIYRTDDAGASWRVQFTDSAPGTFFDGMAFWDERHGVAFGDPVAGSFVIVTTRDGGASWSRVPPEAVPEPLPGEAGFAASGTAIAVYGDGHAWFGTGGGDRARVFRTEDGGTTWAAHDTPLRGGRTAGIFGLTFWDRDNGIAVGGDHAQPNEASPNVLRTTDGGRTWRLIAASSPAGVRYGVVHIPGTPGPALLAVGPSGRGHSSDAGRTWTVIDTLAHNTVAAAPSGALVWTAGPRGRIGRVEYPTPSREGR